MKRAQKLTDIYLQVVKHGVLILLGIDQVLNRGNTLRLLKHMFHQDRKVIPPSILFLKLVRRAVADWWIAENGAWTLFDKLMEFMLLFHKIESEARLLVRAAFQLSEIDAKVELFELVLPTELNTV